MPKKVRKGRKVRMDEWDKPTLGWKKRERFCNMQPKVRIHRKGGFYYISLFASTKDGIPFTEIKNSGECAEAISSAATELILSMVRPDDEWCIVTTPKRRHFTEYHFATDICKKIAWGLNIKFYESAIQCLNKTRINPEFHLLRPITEQRIILFDDICTTGSTITAAYDLLRDRKQVLCIVGINNH